jgi:hypothetical protein
MGRPKADPNARPKHKDGTPYTDAEWEKQKKAKQAMARWQAKQPKRAPKLTNPLTGKPYTVEEWENRNINPATGKPFTAAEMKEQEKRRKAASWRNHNGFEVRNPGQVATTGRGHKLKNENGTEMNAEERKAYFNQVKANFKKTEKGKAGAARNHAAAASRLLNDLIERARADQTMGQTFDENVVPFAGYKRKGAQPEPVRAPFPTKENRKF